jgi:phosphopantothenoylcysteine synthetase/decarboxylase
LKEIVMKYSFIAAILVAFALTACGDPKPGQYPPGLMDEREGMDELDATLQEQAEEEKTVMETIEEAVEDAIEAVEEAFDDDEAEDDDAEDDGEAEDDEADEEEEE